MKKVIIFLIVGILAISMMACNSTETEPVSSETEQVAQFEVPTGPFSEADMVFVHNNVTYPISTDVAPLLQLFGSEYQEIASPSCAFVGEDKQFIYSFATVYTYPMEDVDMINEIYIVGGEYKTSRGIGIGASKDDVIATYGDAYFEQGNSLIYVVSGAIEDTTSPKLYFELTNNAVSGISYFGANGVIQ